MSAFFSVVLSVFLALYVQTSISASCYYYSEDGSSSFPVQKGWMNLTDTKQNTWFVNPCIADGSETSPCPYNSGVCVQYLGSENTVSAGDLNDYLFSSIANGIEYDFGSETPCLVTPECMGCEPLKMKTSLLLNCDPQAYMTVSSVDSDGCYTMIMLNSSSFCTEHPIYLDGDMPMPQTQHRIVYINLPFLLLITCGSLLSICVCCCCAIRRRRCQRQRQQAMQNISNQAFRAIPNQQSILKQAQQPVAQPNVIPAYNPFMMPQQQFVYYYPSQQQAANQQASIVQPAQVQLDDEDEKMAIELQAQFDRESRV